MLKKAKLFEIIKMEELRFYPNTINGAIVTKLKIIFRDSM